MMKKYICTSIFIMKMDVKLHGKIAKSTTFLHEIIVYLNQKRVSSEM